MHWGICEMGPYRGPFYKYGLIAEIKACMSSYVDFFKWDTITHPCPDNRGVLTTKVRMSNYTPLF